MITQFLFDAKKLIIFGDPVSPAERSSFDLSCIRGHRDIRDGGILSFTRSMGNHNLIPRFAGHFYSVQCLRKGTDLIDFHENGIRHAEPDQVSAHDLARKGLFWQR